MPANHAQYSRLNALLFQIDRDPGFIWRSAREGSVSHGIFFRHAAPAFQMRVPRGSRGLPLQSQFQVMRMKTLSGLQFAAAISDIPAGIPLKDVGPKAYAQCLRDVELREPRIVSNVPIVLDDGTPAYRTELHWRNRLTLEFRTLVVSAFVNGKWVLVEAHPWKDQHDASKIVESLIFQIGDQ